MEDILYHDDEYILTAQKYLDDWEYIKAKRILEKLLEDEPAHAVAHNMMGWIYGEHLEDTANAAMHYKLAIKFNKAFPYPYRNYAHLLTGEGKYTEAVALIDEALLSVKTCIDELYHEAAKAYELSLKLSEASEYYKKAILYSVRNEFINQCEQALERLDLKIQLQNRPETQVKYSISKTTIA